MKINTKLLTLAAFSSVIIWANCTHDKPEGPTNLLPSGTTFMPPSTQRTGDATAGRNYLLTGNYVSSGIPLDIFKLVFGATSPDDLGRTGDNKGIAYNFTATTASNGVKVVYTNCLSCHGDRSPADGSIVVGLGNSTADNTVDVAQQFGLIDNVVKARYTTNSPEWRAYYPLSRGFTSIAPFIKTETRGVNPADKIFAALSAFRNGNFDALFKMFGDGAYGNAAAFYHYTLRPSLPDFARDYWDRNISFFNGKGVRQSFYWHGTSGLFAWAFMRFIKNSKQTYLLTNQLFNAKNLAEQARIYAELEPKVLNNFVKWAMNQQITMTLLGVPDSQKQLLKPDTEGVGFFEKCFRQVFRDLPIADNYFWQLYFNGKYSADCAPNYLKINNFETLKNQISSIKTHNTTITDFLNQQPALYSHYVLLDHQDWLAANNRPALADEWRAILKNSRQGTKILLRSAAYEIDFLPDFVPEHVVFEKEKTAASHRKDRVGTYGSVYLGIVK